MPQMGLTGKVAIVTGAGSRADGIGNGRAAAILLAREGVKVALLDATIKNAEATKAMIDTEGFASMVIDADVTNAESCEAAVAKVAAAWGRVDILVNNVGVGGTGGTAVDLDLDAWDRDMRINVTSMMVMARYCIPQMRKQNGGAIVNIASVAGLKGGHTGLMYPTSKGAVVNMTRAMAAHHGREGIRVNCIAPGMVYTPMVYARGNGMSEDLREARRKRSLLQTEGTGWDIGHGVVYLCSDMARWVTGVIHPIDAGATAGNAENPSPPPDKR